MHPLVSFVHISNSLGTINPVIELCARARKADQCQKLGQGMGCELPEDAESALGRQRERGEVQCFNEAKIGL